MAPIKVVQSAISASTLRFAPMMQGSVASLIWKLQVEGNEIYAMTRRSKGHAKISVHFSGQIHIDMHGSNRLLARPAPMESGEWQHALEWRFLLSMDAHRPRQEKLKPKDRYYFVDNPVGKMLRLHLLVSAAASPTPPKQPVYFGDRVRPFWQRQLRSKYWAIMIGSPVTMDPASILLRNHLRHELNPHITLSHEPLNPPYAEVHHYVQSEGRNVLLICPMGAEGYRVPTPQGVE